MMIYSSRRRQIFLYTPIDWFITAVIRRQIAGWRVLRSNPEARTYVGIAMVLWVSILFALATYGIKDGHP